MALGKQLAESLNPSFVDEKDRFEYIPIKDIPIMLSKDGAIVCIPKDDEVFATGIIGTSGEGKSLLLHRIVEHIFYQWENNVAIMNDISEETFSWTEAMKNKDFNEFNNYRLNQNPVALPLVYVFPNSENLNINPKDISNKCYVRTTIPFSDIIENIGFYLSGINKEFEIGKSGMYINDLYEELIECETPEQIKEVLNEGLPGKDGKSFGAMRIKIMTSFDSLFKEEILDVTNPEYFSNLAFKKDGVKFEGNPISVLMKAKVIPSLITSAISVKNYFPEFMSYCINSIFENHLINFPGEKTFLVFDELLSVCKDNKQSSSQSLGNVASRGRINNVGLIYSTQYYDKIPDLVKGAKLNYLFAFKHSSAKILSEVSSDFDLEKKMVKTIKNLKTFECVAMTKNRFVCYRDNYKWFESGPIRGTIFYPLSNHKKPGEK